MKRLDARQNSLGEAAARTRVALLTVDRDCTIADSNTASEVLAGLATGELRGHRFCNVFCSTPCAEPRGKKCIFARALNGAERRAHPRWTTLQVKGAPQAALIEATALRPATKRTARTWPEAPRTAVTIIPSAMLDKADQRKREMLAAAIHDFQQPVSVQTLAIEMLSAQAAELGLPNEARKMIARLKFTAGYLAVCLDELHNSAMFDADATPLECRLIAVRPVVQQVAWHLEPLLLRRKQRIAVRVSPRLLTWADPRALQHVLMNLLTNAHKYSIECDTIVVTARESRVHGDVTLTVTDHGLGIPKNERRQVFQRYYRGSQSGNIRGAGLGLAIVRALIVQHGGTVGVRPGRAGGAQFWIRVPGKPV